MVPGIDTSALKTSDLNIPLYSGTQSSEIHAPSSHSQVEMEMKDMMPYQTAELELEQEQLEQEQDLSRNLMAYKTLIHIKLLEVVTHPHNNCRSLMELIYFVKSVKEREVQISRNAGQSVQDPRGQHT